eukprot:5421129-Amphidinium_carterae.2
MVEAYLFRSVVNQEYQFVARADQLTENATWTVQVHATSVAVPFQYFAEVCGALAQTFIDDYSSKHHRVCILCAVQLLTGGGPPARIDGDVEYYEVEALAPL